MGFPYGSTPVRLRAGLIDDAYNPGAQVAGDWDNPDELPLPGSFVAQTSTALLGNATREQATESKSLFCDGSFDISKGDRIRVGSAIYTIDGIPPEADTNPWTGWTPEREIPLTRSVG